MSNTKESNRKSAFFQIYELLQRDTNHFLNINCATKYYENFFRHLQLLLDRKGFKSKKEINRLCTKLNIGSDYNQNLYMQGVSELLFMFFACKYNYRFEIGEMISSNAETDIDCQFFYKDKFFNIEVKTPMIEKLDPEIYYVDTCFRTMPKEELDKVQEELDRYVETTFENKRRKYKR